MAEMYTVDEVNGGHRPEVTVYPGPEPDWRMRSRGWMFYLAKVYWTLDPKAREFRGPWVTWLLPSRCTPGQAREVAEAILMAAAIAEDNREVGQ